MDTLGERGRIHDLSIDNFVFLHARAFYIQKSLMKHCCNKFFGFFTLMSVAFILGCTTASVEKGPSGTIAYPVMIESSEPGARVEVNGDVVGKTPLTLKVFGDKDGTFHNFGSQQYIIQVFPIRTNQYVQTRAFRTGGWFSQEDLIPKRLYFDLDRKEEGFTLDLPRY